MLRDHDIPRRDLRFDVAPHELRGWHPRGLHVAHFFNALSIFFPEGERFFIDSVLPYRDRIRNPRLAEQLQGFIGQEAMHSREHRRYNEALTAVGLPIEELEAGVKRLLRRARKKLPTAEQLRVTIALEHFTAIMAAVALDDPDTLGGTRSKLTEMWRWHAIEETEHKAVAYDVYEECVGRGPRAYLTRAATMLATSATFWWLVFRYHFRLMRAEGAHRDVRGWLELGRFLWVRPGLLRQIAPPWLAYFRPSFHPWQHDNREHVARWRMRYEAERAA